LQRVASSNGSLNNPGLASQFQRKAITHQS